MDYVIPAIKYWDSVVMLQIFFLVFLGTLSFIGAKKFIVFLWKGKIDEL